MKNTSEVSPWIPFAMPWTSVDTAEGVADFTLSVELEAPESLRPRLSSQLWILSAAWVAYDPIPSPCEAIPPTTMKTMKSPSAIRARTTMTAPPHLGTPWPLNQPTAGALTTARISPATTGSTIVAVAARSRTSPMRSPAAPTRSQDAIPRSRSQPGAEKTDSSASSWCGSSWTT